MLEEIVPGNASFAGSISIDGPPVLLKQSAAQSFALVVRELATDAASRGTIAPHRKRHLRWEIQSNASTTKLVSFGKSEEAQGSGGRPIGALVRSYLKAMREWTARERRFAPTGLTYQTETPLDMLIRYNLNRPPIVSSERCPHFMIVQPISASRFFSSLLRRNSLAIVLPKRNSSTAPCRYWMPPIMSAFVEAGTPQAFTLMMRHDRFWHGTADFRVAAISSGIGGSTDVGWV